MPDEIEPALTPDQWTQSPPHGNYRVPDAPVLSEYVDGEPNLWIEDGKVAVVVSYSEYPAALLPPFKVMAVANAALPDDDPRKITRAKIAALRLVMADSDYMPPSHAISPEDDARRWAEMTRTFAAADELLNALDALLPPDERPAG